MKGNWASIAARFKRSWKRFLSFLSFEATRLKEPPKDVADIISYQFCERSESALENLKTYEGQVPHHVRYIDHCVPISLGAFVI